MAGSSASDVSIPTVEVDEALSSTEQAQVEVEAALAAFAAAAPVPPPPPSEDGEGVASILIPKIGVDWIVVEGVSVPDLRKGPGHYPGTPMPGQPGNSAIAGHRTTYGQPFHRVDELSPGDEIYVTTLQGPFKYTVDDVIIVSPSEVSVIEDFGDNRLTLTACHPKYSARQRIIVQATLVTEAAPAPTPEELQAMIDARAVDIEADAELAAEDAQAQAEAEAAAAAEVDTGQTIDAEEAAIALTGEWIWSKVLVWGAIAIALFFAAWTLMWLGATRIWPRSAKRFIPYVVGSPIVLLALFLIFEQLALGLPAGY